MTLKWSPDYLGSPGKMVLAKDYIPHGPLDVAGNAAAAYSLRNLSTAYSGQVVRVRRSSDNTEQDFTATQITDGTLTTFCGVGDGFVRTWYDQSGNSNDAIQSTASIQPKLVNSGAVIVQNGKPAVNFTGGLCRLTANALVGQSRLDSYIVKATSDTSYILFSGSNSSHSFVSASGQTSTNISSNYNNPTLYANGAVFTGTTRGDVYNFLDGYKLEVHENASTTAAGWSVFDIGCYTANTIYDFVGLIQELVFYNFDQSTNRTAIEANINAHYAIY